MAEKFFDFSSFELEPLWTQHEQIWIYVGTVLKDTNSTNWCYDEWLGDSSSLVYGNTTYIWKKIEQRT